MEVWAMTLLKHSFALLAGAVAMTAVGAHEQLCAQEPAQAAAEKPKEKQGSELLREIRRNRAPILDALAKQHGYRVEPGKVLKRVAPPFPKERMEYYRIGHPSQAQSVPDGPSAMIFQQRDGKLKNWSMTFSGDSGHSVEGLITGLTGIRSQMIEGGDVREARVPGDWVLRVGATDAKIIKQLAEILRNELSLDVQMEFREIERPVYVARGKYTFTPVEGGRAREATILTDRTQVTDSIEIFGKQLVPNSGAGGGSGKFDTFLAWLGDWIGEPIVSEVTSPPAGKLSWNLHARSPFTDQTRAEDHDPMLVLPNITAQTGLTLTLERRPVKTLFVEGTK
jgi:hypothetical protein